jgi:hypothetical protein
LSRLAVHVARRDGEDCEVAQSFGGSGGCVLCVRREERPLFCSHRGRRTGSAGGKTNSQKTNRTVSYSFCTQANRFSFHVTVQFCSPVMHDKKKGSALRHIPQTAARVVTRRGEAWRGGRRRRRRSARERAFFSHTLTTRGRAHLIYWSNSFQTSKVGLNICPTPCHA